MDTLFDAEIAVHYHYGFIGAVDHDPDLPDTRRGQANGLLGAAVPGVLSFMTGLHTGAVPLRILWHEWEPSHPAAAFDDVVEVTFQPSQTELMLWTFQEHHRVTLPRAINLRARYSVAGMDAGKELDTRIDTAAVERAMLELWPAAAEKDVVLRSGSRTGAYWHLEAQKNAQ